MALSRLSRAASDVVAIRKDQYDIRGNDDPSDW
jgi:hypothetical protein